MEPPPKNVGDIEQSKITLKNGAETSRYCLDRTWKRIQKNQIFKVLNYAPRKTKKTNGQMTDASEGKCKRMGG